MKVLFVQPPPGPNSFVAKSSVPEPLAYEILASTMPHNDLRIFDMRMEKISLTQELETYRPNVVGVGCVTASYYECLKVLRETKKVDQKIITIVGGHHASVMPQDFLQDFVDFIVLGEGEQTLRELVDALELKRSVKEVRGLAIPSNGRLHLTGQRRLINLDDMPIPNRILTLRHRNNYFRGTFRPYASMVTSRGCSFRCKFCCQWVLNRGIYRFRNPEKIVTELSQIQEPYVDFTDDNSWENLGWIEDLYLKIRQARIKKKYKLYARSDLVIRRPDLVEKWRSIGLTSVLVGFESFKDEDLKNWKKANTVLKNINAAKVLRDNDVETIGYFMVDPRYTRDDFFRLIDHVKILDIDQPIFSILTPFPGTEIYEEVKSTLITNNYEYFDGMHAVTPIMLPPREFYDLYNGLYKKSYSMNKLIKRILKGKAGFSVAQGLAQRKYLKGLRPVDS